MKDINFELPPKNIDRNVDRDSYAREIVKLASNDNFEQMQENELFLEIYNTALRYLDKELANEKEDNWQKLTGLVSRV